MLIYIISLFQDAMGLQPSVLLKMGAKVMLRSNMWVAAGLTNGSLGTVHGFLFNPEETHGRKALPAAVCVNFPGYRGPAWDPDHPHVVPIPPIMAKWMKGRHLHSRTQVPLTLAYSTTIHKSQGWSLDRVKVDLGRQELFRGVSFVALSRARSMGGLMIDPQYDNRFTHERLQKVNTSRAQEKRRYIDKKMALLAART